MLQDERKTLKKDVWDLKCKVEDVDKTVKQAINIAQEAKKIATAASQSTSIETATEHINKRIAEIEAKLEKRATT